MSDKIKTIYVLLLTMMFAVSFSAQATLVSIDNCAGNVSSGPAVSCEITETPPAVITKNPNNNKLLAWDEVQNHTLTEPLRVDRVYDPNASFISDAGNGDYFIATGTIVSSHYVQWDPKNSGSISADIVLDSQVFAYVTSDANLFASDSALALPGIDYNDFTLRGLEGGDSTLFDGVSTAIAWNASSPGDWTRLITAYSPAAEIAEPAPLPLFLASIFLITLSRRRVLNIQKQLRA
ncbi:hypothetical protein L4C36_20890 [Photobacterium japonica]|uniref:hypothetical protein n=1 Tax=Photobacterium japonica TaxID=2910235 RepID=UPI003D100DCB